MADEHQDRREVGEVQLQGDAGGDRGAIASVYDETDEPGDGEASDFSLNDMSGDTVAFGNDADTASADVADADDESGEMPDDAVEQTGKMEYNDEPEQEAVFSGQKVGNLFEDAPEDFAVTFADKFTDGEVVKSNSGYKSANVNVELKRYENDEVVFYVADIYVKDISCFVTAFAKGKYGKGIRNWAGNINEQIGGIIAINGDYYGGRDDGIVIRNGELYRADSYPSRDVCVLFWDGTMETYGRGKFDANAAIDNGAYQAWNFGPRLLDENGKAKTKFNSDVGPTNPRTALGYFEPGHYCFVVVDGRSQVSSGLTLKNLAKLMEDLGCVRAYNLDGGNTSVMVVGNQTVNNPSNGGRPTSDIIAIVDKP